MDDPLLARARLLVKIGEDAQAASTAISERLGSGGDVSPVSPPKKTAPTGRQTTSSAYVDSPTHKRYDSDENGLGSPHHTPKRNTDDPKSGMTKLKVSVIKGSSLVSCLSGGDVRNFLKRGSTVEIEGAEYKLSTKMGSEWSGNRIELERDYAGDTKLNAFMLVKDSAKRSPKKVKNVVPIPSSEISEAIRCLDDMIPASLRRESVGTSTTSDMGEVRRLNMAKSMNIHQAKGKSYVSTLDTGDSFTKSHIAKAQYRMEDISGMFDGDTRQEPPAMPVSKHTGHASHPKHGAVEASSPSIDRDVIAYQSYTEKYSSQARNAHLESQRKAAMARASKRMKQEMDERKRKEEENKKLKEAKKQEMEAKAAELRDRTKQRVAKLQAAKKQENHKKQEKEAWEQHRKKESESLVQSEMYNDKMLAIKKETAVRLHKKKLREQASKARAEMERERKLTEISLSRRNHDQRTPASFRDIHPIRQKTQQKDAGSIVSSIMTRNSRTASPVSSRRPRAMGNDRYSIDDADADVGEHDQYTAVHQIRRPSNEAVPQSPAWLQAPQDKSDIVIERVQAQVPQGLAAPHGSIAMPTEQTAPSKPSPPVWESSPHNIVPTARDDAEEGEWSDDSLGEDIPPVAPAAADHVEPLQPSGLPWGGHNTRTSAKAELTHNQMSMDEISAITMGSALSPGKTRDSRSRPTRLPLPGGSVVSRKPKFKPLKPIPITQEFVPVPSENRALEMKR